MAHRRRPPPEPLETDDVRAVAVGTALWALAFLLLLPFAGRLSAAGHGTWLWTCLAGVALGLIGVAHCRRRSRRQRRRDREEPLREPLT